MIIFVLVWPTWVHRAYDRRTGWRWPRIAVNTWRIGRNPDCGHLELIWGTRYWRRWPPPPPPRPFQVTIDPTPPPSYWRPK